MKPAIVIIDMLEGNYSKPLQGIKEEEKIVPVVRDLLKRARGTFPRKQETYLVRFNPFFCAICLPLSPARPAACPRVHGVESFNIRFHSWRTTPCSVLFSPAQRDASAA